MVNFFDTANVYAMSESEEILVQALGRRRHDVVVATKARSRMGSGAHDLGLGLIVWSPSSGGFLSGKYQRGADGATLG